ncbi:MAG: clostripain-related cysteine peptidase, partial [bacterium]|nr:clostripain-related cysteine peptidase [bacterium]
MRNVTVGLYVLVFLLVSVNCVICQSATNNDYGIVINKRYVEPAEWTFMVFVNGDNDLEQAAIEDLNEMEQVGSSAGVNIIVQIDRSSGFSWDGYFDDDTSNGNWQGAKRYYVTRDSNTAIINSPEIQDLGEIDMGDPDVLVDFATWTISNYPAQRYALVLWNHGSGLGVEYDRSKRLSPRAISYDDDSGNNISINELGTALSGITANTGVRLDLLGFDACLMAMIEIDYQVMSYADTAVSSEELEPGDGWDYQGLLAALTGNPEMTSLQFGAEIVRTFAADYGPFGDTTLSTINLKHINSAAQALDALARLLATNCSKYRDQIELSRRQTQQYQVATYIDLYDFVDKIKAHVSDSTIRTAAATLLAALSECTISES